jgi:hypothetical protein
VRGRLALEKHFWIAPLLLVGLAPFVAGSCAHRDWVVFVSSDSSQDVVVRVDYAGGRRDVFLGAHDEDVVVSASDPLTPAHVQLLDSRSCAVLASGDLPAEAVVVSFGDGNEAGQLQMEVTPRNEPFSGTLPSVDNRCAGR